MKKIIVFLMLLGVIFSCNSKPEFFTISGVIKNANGEKLYLTELQESNVAILDSIILDDDGLFSFKGQTIIPRFYALRTTTNNYLTLIINPYEQIEIKADGGNLSNKPYIKGSPDSEHIAVLRMKLEESLVKLDSLAAVYRSFIGSNEINRVKDSLSLLSKQIIIEHTNYTKDFIRSNAGSLASLMALYQQMAPRRYFLNPMDDMRYFDLVDSSLMATIPESEAVKKLHSQLKEIKRQLESENTVQDVLGIGMPAPEIMLPNTNGDTIALSSLRGKYVLLDFWASWCGPCRSENPNLVRNYIKYKEKGFEIFQVSLDKKKEAWLNAIEKDNLTWVHVSDLQYWNSAAAKLYGVQSIPASFLLDKNGKIVAKNLRGDALEAKLSEIFD